MTAFRSVVDSSPLRILDGSEVFLWFVLESSFCRKVPPELKVMAMRQLGDPAGQSSGVGVPAGQSSGLDVPAGQSSGLDVPVGQSLGLGVPAVQSSGLGDPAGQSSGLGDPAGQSSGLGAQAGQPSCRDRSGQAPGSEGNIEITGRGARQRMKKGPFPSSHSSSHSSMKNVIPDFALRVSNDLVQQEIDLLVLPKPGCSSEASPSGGSPSPLSGGAAVLRTMSRFGDASRAKPDNVKEQQQQRRRQQLRETFQYAAVCEMKIVAKLYRGTSPIDLCKAFEGRMDWRSSQSIRRILSQQFTYMVLTRTEFGMLGCYKCLWLLWRPIDAPRQLRISRAFLLSDSGPDKVTIMAAISWMQSLAIKRKYGPAPKRHPVEIAGMFDAYFDAEEDPAEEGPNWSGDEGHDNQEEGGGKADEDEDYDPPPQPK